MTFKIELIHIIAEWKLQGFQTFWGRDTFKTKNLMSRTKFVIVHRAIYNSYFSESQDLLVRMNHESSKNNVNIESSAAISFVRHFLLDSKS